MGFVSFMLGFAEYKQSWLERIWVDRLWNWPQMFLGIALSVAVLYWLPKKIKLWQKLRLGWGVVLSVVVASQLLWVIIVRNDGLVPYKWAFFRPLAQVVAQEYEGGSILLPEVTDFLVYALNRYNGIEGKYFVGQMFGPFFYIEGDAFLNWEENQEQVEKFFRKEDIRLMVVADLEGPYMQLTKKEPRWFTYLNDFGGMKIYKVQLPESK
ncbi:MAG: hypothetical protein IIC67_05675 [Thaumarchaeota archaeon]|nr:hypothetical protein [Nitrososphaerota archaeon]